MTLNIRIIITLCLIGIGGSVCSQKEPDCGEMLRVAKEFEKKNELSKAVQFYLNALTCNSALGEEIGPRLKGVFEKIEKQKLQEQAATREANTQRDLARREKENAEQGRRKAYADGLAYKSQIALRDGHRTQAFRLAEFAHLYVDDNNSNVLQALVNAYYYNDDYNHNPIPWESNFIGHEQEVCSADFSPDGKLLVTASYDNTGKIWDVESGNELATLRHDDLLTGALFSPEGDLVITSSYDKTVKGWDVKTGKEVFSLAFPLQVDDMAISEDGKLAIVEFGGNSVKIWDLKNLNLLDSSLIQYNDITSFVFSKNGRFLTTVFRGEGVKIWDLNTMDSIQVSIKHSKGSSIAISPITNLLAIDREDRIEILDWQSSEKPLLREEIQDSLVSSLTFSPEEEYLAISRYDDFVDVWDLNKVQKLFSLPTGEGKPVAWSNRIDFSPFDKNITSGGRDFTARIWDLDVRNEAVTCKPSTLPEFCDNRNRIAFSGDEKKLIVGTPEGFIRSYDLQGGNLISEAELKYSQKQVFNCFISISSVRNQAAIVHDWNIFIVDLNTLKIVDTFNFEEKIQDVSFSPDGSLLAAVTDNQTFLVWNTSTKAIISTTRLKQWIYSFTISHDNKKVAFAMPGRNSIEIQVMELQSGLQVTYSSGHDHEICNLAFSPDDAMLATGGGDQTVKVFDLKSGKTLLTLDVCRNSDEGRCASYVAFSPDGKQLATASTDVKLWDLTTGRLLLILPEQGFTKEEIQCAATNVQFSADGQRLASVFGHDIAKVWDLNIDTIIRNIHAERRISALTPVQLNQYGLQDMLDMLPENEKDLLQTGELPQVIAFADLYADKVRRSHQLSSTQKDFARSARLYQFAIDNQGATTLKTRLGKLYLNWANNILKSSKPDTALSYAQKAFDLLPKDSAALRALVSARLAKHGPDDMALEDNPMVLRAAGSYYFDRADFALSKRMYQKAEQLRHHRESLLNLYILSTYYVAGEEFDFQRLLDAEDPADLRMYGAYFYENQNYEPAYTLFEKSQQLEYNADALLKMYECSVNLEKFGIIKDFNVQWFYDSQNPAELQKYIYYFNKNINETSDFNSKVYLYEIYLKLRESILPYEKFYFAKSNLAVDYVNFSLFQIGTHHYTGAESSIKRALELSPDVPEFKARISLTLLLQGRFDEAKAMYSSMAPMPFNADFPYFRDFFLAELLDWKDWGLSIPNYEEIRSMLEAMEILEPGKN